MNYNLSDYVFDLPADRIAQKPADERAASRLLVARGKEELTDSYFNKIGSFLRAGDVLVVNQTKVMNARCFAQKENGLRVEIFILDILAALSPKESENVQTSLPCELKDPHSQLLIPVLLKPARRLKAGMKLIFPHSGVQVLLEEKGDAGRGLLCFADRTALFSVLEKDGEIPLPPYIKREKGPDQEDRVRYQTVFANEPGAVAAPTAGLHFSEKLLADIQEEGIELCKLTHHVGIGTFKPIHVDDVRDHQMESEHYRLSEESADTLNRAKAEGRRIIAVGTTSTRCLESCIKHGEFIAGSGDTSLYIYPPYRFSAIDGLVTNFHLPGSTLLLLVSALMGRERILNLYGHALRKAYRFYSYGDAMLLIP
ncbi:MAG: tRNA preQ1(34) S-adenosylmethionine ribosyltransferase-isomerase QueA [Acidobacteria bacterium]|nr:MAG: tRNA preQ1(34) S-adenosylmethionine ribosyltransferase-isomerase QueA [Acidobacteriota bacterium]